ncbi:DinB family protein [Paenisporosarcina cavernae]|uniref:DinB family protein n=1 Tax=Paenisporosarcina cavernae TaxID=2320858 RepID=A0A385YVI5_9BACL|nr:DinB family protein [Paenisporosarcina cavernae]AYC30554.1 DinB family protein [Paenisporosarcina cavernae]
MTNIIETYKKIIHRHSVTQLVYSPSKEQWSISQVIDHCIAVAEEYLESAIDCLNESNEQSEGKTEFGDKLFTNGGFPPIKIKLPKEMNAAPKNSENKDALLTRLDDLANSMNAAEVNIRKTNPRLKLQHGGFGWLNAREWFELIDMHFRHHLRQIDAMDQKIKWNQI